MDVFCSPLSLAVKLGLWDRDGCSPTPPLHKQINKHHRRVKSAEMWVSCVILAQSPLTKTGKFNPTNFIKSLPPLEICQIRLRRPSQQQLQQRFPNKKVFTEQKMKSRALWFESGLTPDTPSAQLIVLKMNEPTKLPSQRRGWSHVTTCYSEPIHGKLILKKRKKWSNHLYWQ